MWIFTSITCSYSKMYFSMVLMVLKINATKQIKVSNLSELDNLSTTETQFLVVIQHSVHVLNQDSVYGTVKDIPAFVLICCT